MASLIRNTFIRPSTLKMAAGRTASAVAFRSYSTKEPVCIFYQHRFQFFFNIPHFRFFCIASFFLLRKLFQISLQIDQLTNER